MFSATEKGGSKNQVVLSSVPYEIGFHFYTALGEYTGIAANSMSAFAGKLQTIPIESNVFTSKETISRSGYETHYSMKT